MSLASFIISLLSLICIILGGLWGVYSAIARKIDEIDEKNLKKIDSLADETSRRADKLSNETAERTARIYVRMDENKVQYYKDFVLKEIHDERIKHERELIDQKFISMLKVFETNFLSLTKEIKDLKEYMIERFNNKEILEKNRS